MWNLPTSSECVLEAKELTFAVGGRRLVSGISFCLRPGKCLGIVGPNGAGKTTLLRLLNGYLPPSGGVALIRGEPVHRLPPVRLARELCLVPQAARADLQFTAFEVALMGRFIHSPRWRETTADQQITWRALQAAGVAHLADRLFATLSGGERQRVVLARALAQEPSVLLLDEPTANLDPRFQLAVMDTVRQLTKTRRLAVVAVLHDLTLAARYCDELLLLSAGRPVAAGSPAAVLRPDLLQQVYGITVSVEHHPCQGHLVVLPGRLLDGG